MKADPDLLHRAEKYCAYRDRSIYEMKQKLREWKTSEQIIPEIINTLTANGYLDEERFVESFIRGKFNLKKWGKRQIVARLMARGIAQETASAALSKLDPAQYADTATLLAKRKAEQLKCLPAEKKMKVYRYLLSKGYEHEISRKVAAKVCE